MSGRVYKRDKLGQFAKTNTLEESKDIVKKPFINITLFGRKEYATYTNKQLIKSVKSHKKQIAVHTDKIKNPTLYVTEWQSYDYERQQGLIRRWKREICNFQNQIKFAEDELNGRK